MKKKLFPELPEDLTGLSQEELEQALGTHVEVADRIDARDEEIVAEYSVNEIVEQYTEGAVQAERIRAELTARAEETAQAEASLAEASQRLRSAVPNPEAAAETPDGDGGEGGEGEGAGEGEGTGEGEGAAAATVEATGEGTETPADPDAAAEVVAEAEAATAEAATEPAVEPEPVAASAEPARPRRQLRLPRPSAEHKPVVADPGKVALTASAGIRGIAPGDPLDRQALGRALLTAWETTQIQPGVKVDVVVASAKFDYHEGRQLGAEWDVDGEKIRKALDDEEAVVASGGICATPTPIYDLDALGTDSRPVRDRLSPFQATRGGVNVPDPLSLGDVTTAVGIVTAAEDEAGGSAGTKSCQVLACEDPTDYFVDAVYACVQWGNFGARSWPERVAAFAELVRVAHARLADGDLLTKMQAGSTAVTAAEATYGYGATSNLLAQILAAGAGIKSRHRLDPDTRLDVYLPFWTRELLVTDLRNSQFDQFERSIAGVEQLLREHGIDPVFYLDQATGTAQIFGAQGAGALMTLPDVIHWAIHPKGTFIFLDQGTLDLGIVRDSTLNETNDFQVFFETFEGLAKLGPEALWIESTVCPNGATGGPATLIDCTP